MSNATVVKACAATTCAFNANGCTAFAVTVGGAASEPATCGTFIALDARAGLPVANGQVGACKRLECKHNVDLMCTADAVEVSDTAACLSFEAR